MARLIHGGDVITPTDLIHNGAVLIDDRHIIRVGLLAELRDDPAIEERVDAHGGLIAPGFIDLQLNGAAGRLLTSQPQAETVLAMAEVLPQFGCTAVLPTAITAPIERLEQAVRAVTAARETQTSGARILGIHLEGPFINPERRGAHHAPFIVDPSPVRLARLWDAGAESIRLLTLAPEMPGADETIAAARQLGITIAIGHTQATPEQVGRAAEIGASLVTHLFNAMAPLNSREPGTVGGALANDQLSVSIIADGVHVHPISLNVAVRAKGTERVVLISDGMPPVGTNDLAFTLDGERVTVRDGACYRSDGVLAGSALTMDRAVRTMHKFVGVPLADAIAMASLNPARVVGIADRKGSLEPGKDADVVVLDRALSVRLTMVEGQVRYRSSEI